MARTCSCPLLPVALVILGLVLAEGDLGTAVILIVVITGGLLFVAGAPMRLFVAARRRPALAASPICRSPRRTGSTGSPPG